MSSQHTPAKLRTTAKVQKLRNIFPWASLKRCEKTLKEAHGNVNGACHILAEKSLQFSDDEDNRKRREPTPFVISESNINPSYELIRDPSSGYTLTKPKLSIDTNSAISAESEVKITLPGNYILGDIQETGPGVFELPPGTKFFSSTPFTPVSFKSPDMANECATAAKGSGSLQDKCLHTPDKSWKSQKEHSRAFSPAALFSSSPWSWKAEKQMEQELGSGSVFLTYASQNEFSSGDSIASSSFQNEECNDPFEKRRREFVAAAVISAALPKTIKLSMWIEDSDMDWTTDSGESCTKPVEHPGDSFKKFGMGNDLFLSWRYIKMGKQQYPGTNKGEYIPVPWKHTNESATQGYLQFINALPPYDKFSFEELRIGDYIRERRKAPHLFSLFRKLPLELRLMIWRYSREARIVEFRFNDACNQCWTPCRPPAALQVCQESRRELLRFCQPSFKLRDHEPRIYFDCAIDSLFLTFENHPATDMESISAVEDVLDQLRDADLAKVQNLAVDSEVWDCWNHYYEDMRTDWIDEGEKDPEPCFPALPGFQNLKRFDLVQNNVIGFWKQPQTRAGLEKLEEADYASNNVSFVPVYDVTGSHWTFGRAASQQILKTIHEKDAQFSIPRLGFLKKIEAVRA